MRRRSVKMYDKTQALIERIVLRQDLRQYRRERAFERSVCADDAMPMTDLGEAGA